jgi:hypothetical protein
LRIVKKPKPNFMAILRQQNGYSNKYEKNNYVSNTAFAGYKASYVTNAGAGAATPTPSGNTVRGNERNTDVSSLETNKNGGNVKVKIIRSENGAISYQPQTVVLYAYYFKTSQFRTASEKLKAITGIGEVGNKQNLKGGDLGLDINYKSPEGFDTYDLGFQPVRFGGDKTAFKWPMFLFSDAGNRWGSEFRNPMYEKHEVIKKLLPNNAYELVPIIKYSNGSGIVVRSETDTKNRMLIEPNSFTPEPPLNRMEIQNGGPVENNFSKLKSQKN